MNIPRFSLVLLAAANCAVFASVAADRFDSENIARSPYVHCAFYKGYEPDPATGDLLMIEGKSNSLMHFQGIDVGQARARAIYTRMAGSRNVTVLQTDKAIHFIDNVAGMYIMTSVHSCLEFDDKRGICVTYGAIIARHFDASVLYDPDKVYERLKDIADPGFCDHSFFGVKEAAKDAR